MKVKKLHIKVIGQRYELNDQHVSIIGELIEPKKTFNLKNQLVSKNLN